MAQSTEEYGFEVCVLSIVCYYEDITVNRNCCLYKTVVITSDSSSKYMFAEFVHWIIRMSYIQVAVAPSSGAVKGK
jgi:hypothetical protein